VRVSNMSSNVKTFCNICHQPVIVDADSCTFVHVIASLHCPEQKVVHIVENKVSDSIAENTQWAHAWENCADETDKEFVNFEAQCMSSAAFRSRYFNNLDYCVFNATRSLLYEYCDFMCKGKQVFFCEDQLQKEYEGGRCFFQCSDGKIRETCCNSVVQIRLSDSQEVSVRILKDVACSLISRLESKWTHEFTNKTHKILHPVKVISMQGRDTMDRIHRELFYKFPVNPFTIYNAPPGAGKTTAMKKAVRSWGNKKTLIIVYNKANQEALMDEMKDCVFCTVKTLDALCMAATTNRFGGEDNTDDFDDDGSDKSFVKRNFPRWDPRDKIKHGGGKMSSSIVTHRLTHPRASCTICKKHKRLSMVNSKDAVDYGWNAALTAPPIYNVVKNITTFASRRYLCDRDCKLVKIFDKYDVVLVDEMQDLNSEQEMRLLRQASCPVVMVGDFDQTINDFRHTVNTNACDQREHCLLPSECKTLDLSLVVEWYNTFRLDALSVHWLEDMTGKRMQSMRPQDQCALISWSSVIKHPTDTLIICRKNESVISEAIRHAQIGHAIRVINGVRVASLLKTAASDQNQKGGMSQLAEKLKKDNLLSQTLQMLHDSEISLKTLKSGKFLAVGTVHQLKGFEYNHVAIHRDVFDGAAKEKQLISTLCDNTEKNSLFVALTRHKLSLTILYDIIPSIPPCFHDAEPANNIFKIQQNTIFI